jgi:nitrogen fixation negative regulator NifL
VTQPTILVVEDNPITRKMLRVTLEAEQYAVLEAPDGVTALATLETTRPALVLQDFVLPDMSGDELLRRIRKRHDAAALPVVLLTGLTSKTAQFEQGGGFTVVLSKPVEPSRLVEVVGGLLAAPDAPRGVAALPPRRVLVVDDDPANRKLAEARLRLVGYLPTVVSTVEDALQEAHRQRPDVILGDVLMPGLDGFQLCLAVRRDPRLVTVPVVLVSSVYTEVDDRKLALLVGAADLVERTPGYEAAIAAIEAACAPGAPAPPASGAALDQEYLASLRRQVDRQMAQNQELARRAGIQAAALSMVGALAQALVDPREVSAVLGDVLVHCLDAAGLSTGLLYLRGHDGTVRVHSMAGVRETLRGEATAAFGHPALLHPAGVAVPVAFSDVTGTAAQREFLARLERRSALVVPFVILGTHYGTLVLASDSHDLTDPAWETFARTLAAQFGQAVALGRSVAQLAESDALLRSALEASPSGIVMADSQGRIVMANRQLERMFGYGKGELIGRPLENLIPTRHRTAHVGYRHVFMAEPHGRAMGMGRELWGLHQDGREIPVEIGLAPVKRGEDTYVIASVVDITERRKAEERIRWLSLAVDQGPASIVMTDLAGDIEYVNPKFTEVTGYTLDEVRGKNPRFLKSGATPGDVYRDLWGALTSGQSWHGEVQNRKKDGTLYWDAMWVYPLRDAAGKVTRFLALKEDITERRAAEQAVAESATRTRALMEHAGDGIAVLRADGVVLEANPSMARIVGRPAEAIVGHRLREFSPPTAAEAQRLQFEAAVSAGGGEVIGAVFALPDGKQAIADFSLSMVATGGERVMLAIGRDVTEQRSLEQQLRLAQKMEAVGRLAGGVAHDFNNVLTAIFGYVEMLQEDLPADSGAQEDLEEVRKAAERAAGLTRQLLAFSRQQVLEPVVLSLNDVLQDVEKMLRRVIGEDVELRLNLPPDVGNVRADPGQLQQVIMNLVVNARDAMPRGGTLIVETSSADLTEQYAELHQPVVPGPYVMLAVSDTGTGMTPEVKARVFEPFFTTKERGKGTGLGLSTVYGIVKQSGGYIWAYSELGRGTTFKIYLPAVNAQADVLPPVGQQGTTTGTETVLVAEDDAILRPLAKGLLEKLGYRVLEAENAAAALGVAERHQGPIHLLVADVVMPGGSGRDLARGLERSRPDTKVLYVSGYTDDAIVQHGMLEPGLNFLQKPFTPAALARKVRGVLDGH